MSKKERDDAYYKDNELRKRTKQFDLENFERKYKERELLREKISKKQL